MQVRFEQDLDLNYAEQLITSPGLVHLRSDQLEFDGENLTIAFNRGMKRIELLRIDPPPAAGKNNYMLVKNIGRDTLGLDETTPGPVQPPAKAAATPPSSATPPSPGPPAPPATTSPAVAAAPRPAKEARTSYQLAGGKDVTATLGAGVLTSDQLFVLFSPPTPGENKATTAPGTQTASGNPSSDTTAPTPQAPSATATTTPATSVATVPPAPPIAPAKRDDLEVRWTGPMEMRPAADTDLQLVDRHDSAARSHRHRRTSRRRERPDLLRDRRPSLVPSRR